MEMELAEYGWIHVHPSTTRPTTTHCGVCTLISYGSSVYYSQFKVTVKDLR